MVPMVPRGRGKAPKHIHKAPKSFNRVVEALEDTKPCKALNHVLKSLLKGDPEGPCDIPQGLQQGL